MPRPSTRKRTRHLQKVKTGRWPARDPIETPLFADVGPSVTEADIALWVETVAPGISPLRRAQYVRGYDVAGKIMRAKLAGQWPPKRAYIA